MDAEGNIITENDDDPNNTGRNSFIQGFEIPVNGTYTIVATRFQQELGSTTGNFRLTLELAPDFSSRPTIEPPAEREQTFSGEINEDTFTVEFEFTANQGDIVDIQMILTDPASTLDPCSDPQK